MKPTPQVREKLRVAALARWAKPDERQAQGARQRAKWESPAFRARIMEANRERWANMSEDDRSRHAARVREALASRAPEQREAAARKRRERAKANTPFKGGCTMAPGDRRLRQVVHPGFWAKESKSRSTSRLHYWNNGVPLCNRPMQKGPARYRLPEPLQHRSCLRCRYILQHAPKAAAASSSLPLGMVTL